MKMTNLICIIFNGFKRLFLLVLIFSNSLIFANEKSESKFGFIVKMGIDCWSKARRYGNYQLAGNPWNQDRWDFDNVNDGNVGMSFSIDIPFIMNNKYSQMGLGYTYNVPRSIKNQNGNFNFMPIYFLAKFQIPFDNIIPFIVGHLGYNFVFSGDNNFIDNNHIKNNSFSGQGYVGFGTGLLISRIQIEILYTYDKGNYDLSWGIYEGWGVLLYQKIAISIGYYFEI